MYSRKGYMDETYEILGYLGSGSGGVIYKAYHKRLQKEVVLKKIKRKSRDARINRNEVDILKNLNHMYLPQVVDFFEENGEIYTAMSFIPGRSLKELMEERRQFSQRQLIRWAMQLCSALNYLHTQTPPIIHGDIKPANIMVTPRGDVCLIDFNVSFAVNGNTVLGYTEGYASPEQYIIALDSREGRELPQYRVIDEKSETGEKKVPVDVAVLFDKDHHRSLKAGKMEKKRDQVKIKQFGKDSFSIGRENVDLKYVEQILDAEQTTALAYCLKNLLEEMERKEQDVDLCVEKLWSQIKKQGLASLCKGSYLSVAMAQIRKQDIYACLNRYRGFIG